MVNEELADPDGFGTDTVGTLMAKYDTDGSGSFNIQEYAPLARTNAVPHYSMGCPLRRIAQGAPDSAEIGRRQGGQRLAQSVLGSSDLPHAGHAGHALLPAK